jgi:hypothetical protein
MAAPLWATEIVAEVSHEHHRRIPSLIWRQSRKKPYSTGSTSMKRERIVITAGTAGHDHGPVLLHELAHYLTSEGEWGHTKEFYVMLKRLLITYHCFTDEYRQREYRYNWRALLYL